ncbi:hypothetical protein RA2_04258 [Roseovarius sp. A-2]|uniref:UPF0149 family protein n=1 Tax=Roseovarius sp. A-2 TaxID=1570360 RepID=UPI0009B58355|nr:UPF0149 family protein [Roseovarius sp. A-2]GAW37182.1 hypothetical protein RA2_04258 [Roseovarius sp. A-2]
MLSPKIQTLLDALPQNPDATGARHALKRVALSLIAEPEQAVAVVEATGRLETRRNHDERLVLLLSSTLDEARMARENGKTVGASFIDQLEDRIQALKARDALTDPGRLLLASCWVRAGLPSPDALAGEFSMPDDMGEELDLSDAPDLEPLIDKLLEEVSGDQMDSISTLHSGFSELMATFPAPVRQAVVRQVVSRPKTVLEELGCALLLDGRAEIRRGAIDGLADRLAANAMTSDMIGRLTVMRSWIADDDTRTRIDAIVRNALRQETDHATSRTAPKVHRALTSLVDGTGAQSMTIALQADGTRSVAVVLIKQGFGLKDAYLVPCSSASEQRRLIDMIASEVEIRDVPVDYIAEVIAIGLSDGLQTGHPPAAGLAGVVQALGWSELRPRSASVYDIAALADPQEKIPAMSAQARGRMINASSEWETHFPMISESWFEDSDAFTTAIEASKTPAALKRDLWQTLDARRSHWARVIARMAHLLHAAGDPKALQFVAVAMALEEGRALKKTPIMEMIFDQSFQVWLHENVLGNAAPYADDHVPFEVASGPAPAVMTMPDIRPEKSGELGKLLKPAGLTEWWVDGYMMGVCTAPKFVPPGAWAQVLLNIIGPEIKSDKALQRILDLLMLRYNGALTILRTPVGVALIPEEETLISTWADGYLTAWDGNLEYWPKPKLGKHDKSARELLENAASWQADGDRFRKTIPIWLRQRFVAQAQAS